MLPARLFTSDEDKKSAYEGSELLLQGVIDCLYSDENGKLHLIDYKTDRLKKEELEDKSLAEKALSEKHALQLSYYALAVEKIFGQRPESVKIYSLHLGDTVNIKPLFF
jgi:ATP-dependent helicase/nuclease subunit A